MENNFHLCLKFSIFILRNEPLYQLIHDNPLKKLIFITCIDIYYLVNVLNIFKYVLYCSVCHCISNKVCYMYVIKQKK